MSILKNRPLGTTNSTDSTTETAKTTTLEELNKLLETVGTADKQLRTTARQTKRLTRRIDDLGCDTHALKYAREDLDEIDVAALNVSLNSLRTELDAAIDAPNNVTSAKLSNFKRRAADLQADIAEYQDLIQSAETAIQAAEDKADDTAGQQKPDSPASITIDTNDQLSAKMLAVQMLSDYRAAGCPPLKDREGHEINFCLPIDRHGVTKYVKMDPKMTDAEDLPDLVAGYFDKKSFVPLGNETGTIARELILLAHTPKLW